MNDLIIGKVSAALKGHWANPDLVRDSSVVLLLFPAPLLLLLCSNHCIVSAAKIRLEYEKCLYFDRN